MEHLPVSIPVLLILYNRPEMVAKSLAALRRVRPERIWVSLDAPRDGDSQDQLLCAEVRSALRGIDWPCEVRRQEAATHLGCRDGVIVALDWFFDEVEAGIILEDDCVPEPSFFGFCDDLLGRYASAPEVMMVSGNNFEEDPSSSESYSFSRYGHMWGWATWRRAWSLFDRDLEDWPTRKASNWLRTVARHPVFLERWTQLLDGVREGAIDTWDVQWCYTVFKAGGLVAVPAVNLVSNFGFDEQATHTREEGSPYRAMKTSPLKWPLQHPSSVAMRKNSRLLPSRAEVYLEPFRSSQVMVSTDDGTGR